MGHILLTLFLLPLPLTVVTCSQHRPQNHLYHGVCDCIPIWDTQPSQLHRAWKSQPQTNFPPDSLLHTSSFFSLALQFLVKLAQVLRIRQQGLGIVIVAPKPPTRHNKSLILAGAACPIWVGGRFLQSFRDPSWWSFLLYLQFHDYYSKREQANSRIAHKLQKLLLHWLSKSIIHA